MFPGHQRTWARIIRTDTRMKAKLARNATKKQNSGNRPVCTICVVNHPDMRPYRPRCAARLILLTCSPPGLVKHGRRRSQTTRESSYDERSKGVTR